MGWDHADRDCGWLKWCYFRRKDKWSYPGTGSTAGEQDLRDRKGYHKGKEEIRVPEKITTGKLKCSLDKNTKTLDKNYSITFRFTDNELEKTEFSILTKGDATGDEEELNNLAATCKRLEQQASSVNGLYVKCTFTTGKLEEIQSFDLSVLNTEDLSAAFTEAGANRPEYQYKQDMDKIEQQMNASGYTCQRER